ncbi:MULTISPECIES: DUF5986 family protein [Bacillus]|uniref:DUF5986 family protein n=1 Tax=Bacillus TaxID=1386 RepID=UPI0003749CE1|nr:MULTISPECIES: DUF5986 family protein [Bacillus]PEP49716.1 hypothetical protein CN564_25225 [Bacillus pseudomycoides]PHC93842.1 hypothetical protein COF36_13945 [Bacillus pseudomycoides]
MPFKLNVNGDSIRQIIQRIQASLYKANDRLETDYGFNNGHGMAKWSFIYSHQIGNDTEEFTSFKTKRNGWKVAGLVDTTTKTLFFFLSQKNLEARQQGKIRSKAMYYISALSGVCNVNFEEKLDFNQRREIQISWDLAYDEDEARQIHEEMLRVCPCEIEQFCVISLDMRGYELKSVKANILNENLDTLYEEDWSDFITVASNDDSDKDDKQQEQEQHDMTVSLKKKQKQTSE